MAMGMITLPSLGASSSTTVIVHRISVVFSILSSSLVICLAANTCTSVNIPKGGTFLINVVVTNSSTDDYILNVILEVSLSQKKMSFQFVIMV